MRMRTKTRRYTTSTGPPAMRNRAREHSNQTPTPYQKTPRAKSVMNRSNRNTTTRADRMNIDPEKIRLTRSAEPAKLPPELLSHKHPRNLFNAKPSRPQSTTRGSTSTSTEAQHRHRTATGPATAPAPRPTPGTEPTAGPAPSTATGHSTTTDTRTATSNDAQTGQRRTPRDTADGVD